MAWLQPGSYLKHFSISARLSFVVLFLEIFIFLQKHNTFVEETF